MISNAKPVSKIDQLIQEGLGRNINKLPYYREVMQDPGAGVHNLIYSDYMVEIYNSLLNYCLNDSQMYLRLRQLLRADHRNITARAFESLLNKSIEHKIPVDTLVEVYNRGYRADKPAHLTNEQYAFNRVNSYIANGKASKIDHDLSPALSTIKKVVRNG